MEKRLSQYKLDESDYSDFSSIFNSLTLKHPSLHTPKTNVNLPPKKTKVLNNTKNYITMPSLKDFSKFKSWMFNEMKQIEVLLNMSKSIAFEHSISNMESKKIVVDITNILYQDLDEEENPQTSNIISIRDTLVSKGYNPFFIADASTKHKVDEKREYKKLVSKKIIYEAPAGRPADQYVLKYAQDWQCKFLTNDMFKEYWNEFGKEWVLNNRITYMFVDGQLLLD